MPKREGTPCGRYRRAELRIHHFHQEDTGSEAPAHKDGHDHPRARFRWYWDDGSVIGTNRMQ
jgi:hypothetical protein